MTFLVFVLLYRSALARQERSLHIEEIHLNDYFTFWVGPIIFGVPSPVPMVLSPCIPEFMVRGASPVVLGGLRFANREIIMVDLRRLFGVPVERTLVTTMVVVDYLGTRYAFMVDSLDTEFHFDRVAEELDGLPAADVPLKALPYVASIVSGSVGGVRKELYRLNLAKILSPETLMVN